MALPLPRVVADVGPGGPLVTAMGGINSLANNMILRRINKIKEQYAPLSAMAQAASQLSYSNLVGPQYIAKMMSNPQFMGNLTDEQRNLLNNLAFNAAKTPTGANALSQLKLQQGQQAPKNPLSQDLSMPQERPIQPQNPMQHRPKDGVTLEGEQWYNSKGEPVYEEDEATPNGSMKLELTEDQSPKSYAQKAGDYLGDIKQGEESGRYRAAAQKDTGQRQIGLSYTGAVLDRMTDIIKNPVFWNMRNKVPFFQDKQLDWLKKTGTPEEQELIGDFLSTAESFIASTVQGFGGRPLVREFDLAQRQKITPNDTVSSALGKLRSAHTLHDIAEQKNSIMSQLLKRGYSEADAIEKANKMVDIKAIEKETNDRLQRRITIRNNKTGEERSVTVEEARKLGVPNV
jgi:hypothetical protein